jgi:hypothetical protein
MTYHSELITEDDKDVDKLSFDLKEKEYGCFGGVILQGDDLPKGVL